MVPKDGASDEFELTKGVGTEIFLNLKVSFTFEIYSFALSILYRKISFRNFWILLTLFDNLQMENMVLWNLMGLGQEWWMNWSKRELILVWILQESFCNQTCNSKNNLLFSNFWKKVATDLTITPQRAQVISFAPTLLRYKMVLVIKTPSPSINFHIIIILFGIVLPIFMYFSTKWV